MPIRRSPVFEMVLRDILEIFSFDLSRSVGLGSGGGLLSEAWTCVATLWSFSAVALAFFRGGGQSGSVLMGDC